MSDTSAAAEARPVERTDYQPLSVLALTAAVVATLYAALVLVLVVYSLISSQSMIVSELPLAAVLGVALSVAGRVQVRQAEGALAGLWLTRYAWWVSVLAGVGYGAYLFGNSYFARSESVKVAREWFDALSRGETKRGFLLAAEPDIRRPFSPLLEDAEGADRARAEVLFNARFGGPRGPITAFEGSEVVRLFERTAPEDVTINHLGQKDYTPAANGFTAVQTFQVLTPEGAARVTVVTKAKEADAGRADAGRYEWMVGFTQNMLTDFRQTRYGRMVSELRGHAKTLITGLLVSLNDPNRREDAYLATVEPDVRIARQQWKQRTGRVEVACLVSSTGLLGAPKLDPLGPPAGMATFPPQGFFRMEPDAEPGDEDMRTFVQAWRRGSLAPFGVTQGVPDMLAAKVTFAEDEVRVERVVVITIDPLNYGLARVTVVNRDPDLIALLNEAREAGRADRAEADESTGTYLDDYAASWRVVGIRSDLKPYQVQLGKKAGPKSR